jgi:hypothetical protein
MARPRIAAPACEAGCGNHAKRRLDGRGRGDGFHRTCGHIDCVEARVSRNMVASGVVKGHVLQLAREACERSGVSLTDGFGDDLSSDLLRFQVRRGLRQRYPSSTPEQREFWLKELLQ